MLKKLKEGDTVIFKNGEEAIVEEIVKERRLFRPTFNKWIEGTIGLGLRNNNWQYTEEGIYDTSWPNGNDIVKVIPC